jgi:hypothetical protein
LADPSAPCVSKSVADLVAEHLTLSTVSVVALLLIGGLVWVLLASARAKREGREFSVLWGFFSIGAQPNPVAGLPADSQGLDTYRTVLGMARAGVDLSMASDEKRIDDRESYLLTALIQGTRHGAGRVRRASILKVEVDDAHGESMVVRRGLPIHQFKRPPTVFPKKKFDEHGRGLCWSAVYRCMNPDLRQDIGGCVYHAADVGKLSSYVLADGEHSFKSILIAPIPGPGKTILGVVCLDCDEPDYYSELDQYLIATAASVLSSAWLALQANVARNSVPPQAG